MNQPAVSLIESALGTDDRTGRDRLRPAMPVLRTLHDTLPPLAPDTAGLVGLQHLFGSTATLIDALAGQLPDPSRVYLLGKPYSTNPAVFDSLRDDSGYWVHPASLCQPVAAENDEVMDGRIHGMLSHIARAMSASDGRFVLIDDGARAIRMLHTPEFESIRDRFTCVEQTRCGTRHLERVDLRIPVVNVAESRAKLEFESPLIAESVVRELNAQLVRMRARGIRIPSRACIIGYGAIGTAVAGALGAEGFTVSVYDPDPSRRVQAVCEGYAVTDRLTELLDETAVVVGCTGLAALGPDEYPLLAPGTILISASSADIEFQAWNLRRSGVSLGRPGSWGGPEVHHPCFSLYRIPRKEGAVYLVNGGFPVNFNGGVDPIAPDEIQLTRSLLYSGAIQASHSARAGLVDLDSRVQERLLNEYHRERSFRSGREEEQCYVA